MNPVLIVLVLFLLLFGFGGHYYDDGAYRNQGFGLGGVVLLIVVVLLLTHRL